MFQGYLCSRVIVYSGLYHMFPYTYQSYLRKSSRTVLAIVQVYFVDQLVGQLVGYLVDQLKVS